MERNWQCRWSPTLGALEDTHQKVWGTDDYTDPERPTVFFGLYGLPDFYALWRHKGEKHILWAGSDITHFVNGYWLEDSKYGLKLDPLTLGAWITRHCTSWVENHVEARALHTCGIAPRIYPSFLGDVHQFEISFKPGNKLYTSVSGDNFDLYGWHDVVELAKKNPDIEFHFYGNTKEFPQCYPNMIIHGRVPKEQMNAEIKEMQGSIRMTKFDGFSEITAKSLLMGQYPVSFIDYPYVLQPGQLREILNKTEPNTEGRDYYIKTLNNYPWKK